MPYSEGLPERLTRLRLTSTMTDLSTIPGISKASSELLEAAGFFDVQSLAKAGVEDLVEELERANGILRLAKRTPSSKEVKRWIATARKNVGFKDEPVVAVPVMPVNYEATEQVKGLLAIAPLAIPLPARQLVENQLAVSDIPPAILLNRYSGDLEIRVSDRETTPTAAPLRAPQRPPLRSAPRPSSSGYVQLAEPGGSQRLEFDTSRIRSIADLEKVVPRIAGSKPPSNPDAPQEHDRVALIRAPLESTNRGRDPRSRSYVRGVLHTHPIGMILGAMVTLTLAVLLPLAAVASTLLLLSVLFPENFPWVSHWFLVFPCALPVLGIFYLIYGVGGRCRICTQRVFMPRACRKNSKAHHLPGLGHIIPLCLHILLFHWFRCTYCGTPVRLKK